MMNGPSIVLTDDEDVINVDSRRPSLPPAPSMPPRPAFGTDLLINRRKVGADVLSMSSSSSEASERGGGGSGPFGDPIRRKVDDDGSTSDSRSYNSDGTSSDDGGGSDRSGSHGRGGSGSGGDMFGQRILEQRKRMEQEKSEKAELLYQFARLSSLGYQLPKTFTAQSDLEEMRVEYQRITRQKEVDASIRFQRKLLMCFVSGVEFMNDRFDPFAVHLSGWSESVHEGITEYDSIFEELHDKYRSTGRKIAPELRLLLSLGGSAVMYHMTSTIFKQSALPNVEQVLRSNPALFKQFQQAAVVTTAGMNAPSAAPMGGGGGGGGGGIFGMLSSMMAAGGGGGGGAMPRQMVRSPPPPPSAPAAAPPPAPPMPMSMMRSSMMPPPSVPLTAQSAAAAAAAAAANNGARIETMSVTDDEITSIIEEEMAGVLNETSRRPAPARGRAKRTIDIV